MMPIQMILFTAPIALIAAGFVIGGRDGAIFSIVGAVALLAASFWQVIKIGQQMDKMDKKK
jgi:hypothetical protein